MTTTLNSSYQSKPLIVPQGGSGVATNTAYGLLAAGTTAAGSIQQAGTGASGQLYKSGGSSALGSYVDSKSNTCMQLISTQTASNSASITFSSLVSTYFAYKIFIDAVVSANAATTFQATLNGASSNFQYASYSIASGTTTTVNSASASTIFLSASGFFGNASSANNYEITLIAPNSSLGSYPILIEGHVSTAVIWGAGWYTLDTSAITSITFQFASGNITSGTFKLYGILA